MESSEDLTDRKAARTGVNRLPPVGFWSYARQDDLLSSGRLTALRSLLVQELQQQFGREKIRLFQDASTIPHGSEWEQEIRRAIEDASFFIPIITPNFIQSEWCCREFVLFEQRERDLRAAHPELAERRLIFPLVFIGIDDSDPEDPDVLAALEKLQWFDFRRFRHRSLDEAEVREAVSELASGMRALLKAKLTTVLPTRKPELPVPAEPEVREPTATEIAHRLATESDRQPTRPARDIKVGDVLNHMFAVRRFLKQGGMGQVFEGSNVTTGERVAIKALLPALANDPKIVELFQREGLTLGRLSHEALVQYRVLTKEPELGALYIVTEFVDGTTLANRSIRCRVTSRPCAGC